MFKKKKKKKLNSTGWVYGRHWGNVRPAPWPAECQLSSGVQPLEVSIPRSRAAHGTLDHDGYILAELFI